MTINGVPWIVFIPPTMLTYGVKNYNKKPKTPNNECAKN